MSRASNLANAIERSVTGPLWHGPALRELLADITAGEAAAPLAGMHSIWQEVLHVITWTEAVRRWLDGLAGDPPESENWPVVTDVSDDAWTAARDRLARCHHDLATAVAALDEARISGQVVGRNYSVGTMLHGVVAHDAYHGGQIALLKKLVR